REARVLQQAVGVQNARRAEKMPRGRQSHAGEPSLAGTPIHPCARRDLADRLHFPGRAQRLLLYPPQLARQRRQRLGELVEELARRGESLLLTEHLPQSAWMVVVVREDNVLDAPLAERQEHARGLGCERGVQYQRQ